MVKNSATCQIFAHLPFKPFSRLSWSGEGNEVDTAGFADHFGQKDGQKDEQKDEVTIFGSTIWPSISSDMPSTLQEKVAELDQNVMVAAVWVNHVRLPRHNRELKQFCDSTGKALDISISND
jgi:hypothetical protein